MQTGKPFNYRFRYSGRTQHQAKKTLQSTERTNPAFERTASTHTNKQNTSTLSSQSMQGISPRHKTEPELVADQNITNKRHTLGHNLPDDVSYIVLFLPNDSGYRVPKSQARSFMHVFIGCLEYVHAQMGQLTHIIDLSNYPLIC